jgi:membrane-associated phospholipid phosphatase
VARGSGALLGAAVAAGLVLIAMFWLVDGHHVAGLDRHAFSVLAASPGSALARVAKPAATIGPLILAVVVLVVMAMLGRRREWLEAFALAGGFLLCAVAAHLAKVEERRPRPSGGLISAGGYSFPSTDSALSIGLIAIALVIARVVAHRERRIAVIAAGCLLALGAGLLFVALRVHYLSDVIAGWALGVAAFASCGLGVVAVRR